MIYIKKAIKIAKKGFGYTTPNPLVGAIIIKNNKIISTGYHVRSGSEHAEVIAIKKAGKKARGARMYINLEPCCHQGKTPPCTKAIIQAGIKEVYIAMLDPNPLIAGQGKKQLEKVGIKVFLDKKNEEAQKLNEIFCKYITTKKPFVAIKWAMSMDGKIATYTGDSKWISNKKSRQTAHRLRHLYDAIIVGVNTVIKDDPHLNVRGISNPSHPIRIILDSNGTTPLTAKIFTIPGKIIIASTKKISKKKEIAYIKLGATVIKTKDKNGKVDIKELLKKLGKLEITSVLVEGGGDVLASFVEQNLVDKAFIYLTPKMIGGAKAKIPVAGIGIKTMDKVNNWHFETIKHIDNDILITAYPL